MKNVQKGLNGKTKNELQLLAKELNVRGYSKLNKSELVKALSDVAGIERHLWPSWWKRYHNHVYGVATLVALCLGIPPFVGYMTRADSKEATESRSAAKPVSIGKQEGNRESEKDLAAMSDKSGKAFEKLAKRVLEPMGDMSLRLKQTGGSVDAKTDKKQAVERRYISPERTASEVEAKLEGAHTFEQTETFNALFMDHWVKWTGKLLSDPKKTNEGWLLFIQENDSDTRFFVYTMEDVSNWREGDEVKVDARIASYDGSLVLRDPSLKNVR